MSRPRNGNYGGSSLQLPSKERQIVGRNAMRNAAHEMLDKLEWLERHIAPRNAEPDKVADAVDGIRAYLYRMIGTTEGDRLSSDSQTEVLPTLPSLPTPPSPLP